jgi:hypothetical protein
VISRDHIVRDSDAQIEARRRRQSAVAAARAANQMAKCVATVERRGKAEEPQAPQRAVSEVLNLFRREYESLTESEQIAFEAIVKRYVVGRVSVDEWTRVTRSIRASYGWLAAWTADRRADGESQGSIDFATGGLVTAHPIKRVRRYAPRCRSCRRRSDDRRPNPPPDLWTGTS